MPLLYEHDPDLNEIFVNHISPGTQKHAGNRHGIWQLIEMKPAGQKGINTIWGEFCFIFFKFSTFTILEVHYGIFIV